jgi:hypothetical protein
MESAIGVGEESTSPLASAFDLFIGTGPASQGTAEAAIRTAPVQHDSFD